MNAKLGTKLSFVVIALFFVITVSCGESEGGETQGSAGRTMEVHASDPIVLDKAFFVDESGKTNVLVPSASNRQIVVIAP